MPRQSLSITKEMSDEEWLSFWAVNVYGVFYCTRAALKLMEPQQYGRIINIASTAGISGDSPHSIEQLLRAGVFQMDLLHQEVVEVLADEGIRYK